MATVRVSGSSRVVVSVSERLDVEASGAAVMEHLGDPELNVGVSGPAQVRKR